METFICKYCGKEYDTKNKWCQHEIRCKENPNRIKSGFEIYNDRGHKGFNQYTKAKQLGLEKPQVSDENKERIAKLWKGKHLPEDMKQKISDSLKQFYLNNPDKIPYKVWHSSNISYPEQYFIDLFKKENINLKYHLQVGLYELDFYNEDTKKYVEIDGSTHYKKHVKEIDERKDNYLNSLNWTGFRIKWDEYKKLSYEDKHKLILNIKEFVNN